MKDPIFYKIVRPIITGLFRFVYKPTYIGLENIPKNQSLVIAGNHTNNLDCLLLISSTKRCIHFMGKHTLFKGIKKYLFTSMGVIPVNRTIKDKNCMIEARKVLNNNLVIGIFPEGTINRTNDIIMPFKMGAVKACSKTNSVLVPFIITGKYKLFRKSICLEFLKPMKIGDDLEKENKKFMDKVSKKLIEGGSTNGTKRKNASI